MGAMTVTIEARGSFGNKKMVLANVAGDDSTTTVDATDLEMHYIDHFQYSVDNVTSAPAATFYIARSSDKTNLVFSEALKTGSDVKITAIGW